MRDSLRFVDSDTHIVEPPDLFDRYLDPRFWEFWDQVAVPVGADGRPNRGLSGLIEAHLSKADAAAARAEGTPP